MGGRLSLGTLRRWLRPVVMAAIGRHADHETQVELDGFVLTVPPTVFHPKYFGTSRILSLYLASLNVAGRTVLDMGCGSGLIALHAARAGAKVTAVDLNPAAVEATLRNAQQNGAWIEAIRSDLFEALGGRRFDLITWNPPFFRGEARTIAERGFFAGPNLETVARFARDVREHLSEGGAVYMIFSGDADLAAIGEMFAASGLTFTTVNEQRWGLGELIIIKKTCRI